MPKCKPTLTAFNTFANSADAMVAIMGRYFDDEVVVDATYGLGTFYTLTPNRVVGVDIRPTADVMATGTALPFADNAVGVGVVDPPYKRGGTRYKERYGDAPKTETKVERLYFSIIPEAVRVSRRGVIIKCQDSTDGHRFYDRRFRLSRFMFDLTGLECHDVALVVTGRSTKIVPGKTQNFFARTESYFLVYSWRQKSPFRQMRY